MPKIIGHGAPTSSTPGVLGQEYFDKDAKKVYTCVGVELLPSTVVGDIRGEFEWAVIGGGIPEPCVVTVNNNKIDDGEAAAKAFMNGQMIYLYDGFGYCMPYRVRFNEDTAGGPGTKGALWFSYLDRQGQTAEAYGYCSMDPTILM